jgi:hypothetical protein
MSALLTYELNGVALDRRADEDHEFEKLALWVVIDKPDVADIAKKLETLTEKYRVGGISKFVSSIRDFSNPL